MNPGQDIRKEELFLIKLCRLQFSVEEKADLPALALEIADWHYFASLANSHGVAALAWHNICKLELREHIPPDIAELLKNILLISFARNVRNTEMTAEALGILNRENINIVLLKGMALEQMVYENRGLRQMTDVDILADTRDCIKARDILLGKGFDSFPVKSVFYKLIIPYTGKHLPSLKRNGCQLEIHHELFGAGKRHLTGMLFETSDEIQLSGEKTFVPKPQIFFLYLVKHLFLHEMNNESQLRLYTDLVVMIDKFGEQIINSDLLNYADQADMNGILAARLDVLRNFWGVVFPDWLNDYIYKWNTDVSLTWFLNFLRNPKGNPRQNQAWFYRSTIKDIPGIHKKIIFIAGDLFPTITWMKSRYNCRSAWRAVLHYPHRFGKLFYLVKGS